MQIINQMTRYTYHANINFNSRNKKIATFICGSGRGGFSSNRPPRKTPKTAEQLDAEMDSYMRSANKPEPLQDSLMEIEQL